mgnify:CR=1 FL=1
MKIKIPYKSVVVSSVFLGVLISLQFKTINLENEGMTTSKKGEQLLIELKSLKKESNSLKEQINIIKREIDKYKEDEGDDILKSEIKYYEELAGYTNVKGTGIIVKLIKNSSEDSIIYNYDLILSIVNKLNSAQASAISINGERLLTLSKIKCSGSTIKVNDTTYGQPFIIKAIGDLNTLKASVISPQSYTNILQEVYGIYIKVEEENDIIINSFKKYE